MWFVGPGATCVPVLKDLPVEFPYSPVNPHTTGDLVQQVFVT